MKNMPNIKKMPVIGTITTKVIKLDVIGTEQKEPYVMPAETYEVVDTHTHEGKIYFITNVWYKEHKRVPLIIVEDIVENYKAIKDEKI